MARGKRRVPSLLQVPRVCGVRVHYVSVRGALPVDHSPVCVPRWGWKGCVNILKSIGDSMQAPLETHPYGIPGAFPSLPQSWREVPSRPLRSLPTTLYRAQRLRRYTITPINGSLTRIDSSARSFLRANARLASAVLGPSRSMALCIAS